MASHYRSERYTVPSLKAKPSRTVELPFKRGLVSLQGVGAERAVELFRDKQLHFCNGSYVLFP